MKINNAANLSHVPCCDDQTTIIQFALSMKYINYIP